MKVKDISLPTLRGHERPQNEIDLNLSLIQDAQNYQIAKISDPMVNILFSYQYQLVQECRLKC